MNTKNQKYFMVALKSSVIALSVFVFIFFYIAIISLFQPTDSLLQNSFFAFCSLSFGLHAAFIFGFLFASPLWLVILVMFGVIFAFFTKKNLQFKKILLYNFLFGILILAVLVVFSLVSFAINGSYCPNF